LEEEAELSGSDIGPEDLEDLEDLDEYEPEEGDLDPELPSQRKIRLELGRIHR
jgi:hypothetical protein